MTRRTSIISQLGNYFASKGGVMSAEEYKMAEDTPVRFTLVKRTFGSWRRLLNSIGDIGQYSINEEVAKTPIEPVVPPTTTK